MSFLLQEDYSKIIEKAISLEADKIGYFFYSEYQRVKESNLDFVDSLRKTIVNLEIRYNDEKEKKIVEQCEKEMRVKGFVETDYRNIIDWEEVSFWYYSGKVFFEFNFYWKENQYLRFTISTLNKLKIGLDKFNEMITDIDVNEQKTIENNNLNKIKWKGTPAQFCYVIDLLINKGYIEQPTPKGERSARILLEHFEIENHNPSIESMGKILHKDIDQIKNIDHRKLFQKIPHRNDLDK